MNTTHYKSLRSILGLVLLCSIPLWAKDQYQIHIISLIAIYWILVTGLNLVVGYTGQLSIGHVGLLCIGAYAFSITVGKYGLDPYLGTLLAGGIGAICGLVLGLPSLRLPGFYFAMATMAFSLIVSELVMAQGDLTGGGIGLPGPLFNAPFESPVGFYYLVLIIALLFTWASLNLVHSMWGRALISIRDSEVAAQAMGVPILKVKLIVFIFSGFAAGVSGALFASLQSYITPDTFVFELSLFFFVCIIIGGKGSIFGPFLGTVVLTTLPELAAPLAKLGNLFYGLLLLIVVLVIPEGIGRLVELLIEKIRPRVVATEPMKPNLAVLANALRQHNAKPAGDSK
jgi:branched-chain amino acid transport system permease protein